MQQVRSIKRQESAGKASGTLPVVLQVEHISKEFPGVKALDDVSFDARSGEILGLVGENGAGKSTIIQIISGAYQKDYGTIKVDGQGVEILSPRHSIDLGIAVVYQKLQLIDTMSVAENICLYEQSGVLVSYKAIEAKAQKVLDEIGIQIDLWKEVKDLPPGVRQFVEMAKALSTGARILILDEPTASLTDDEVKQLFVVLRRLRSQGVAIVYVSHRFDEIFELTDRVTILRNGKLVETVNTSDIDGSQLVAKVIGRKLLNQFPDPLPKEIGDSVLEFRSVSGSRTERIYDVSFTVRQGEILGVYGLQYSGLQEIADILCGDVQPAAGELVLYGEQVYFESPHDAIQQGIVYLTNDRLVKGSFPIMTVRENLTASSLGKYLKGGVIREKMEIESSIDLISRLDIQTTSGEKQMQYLSGGNQQKVLVGRLLDAEAKILVMHEPTHGIDVGSKFDMYQIMIELAAQGFSIIFLSTELEEILSMSDSIIVINKGRVRGHLSPDEADMEKLHGLASL